MAIVSSVCKDLRISLKHSMVLCDNLRGKRMSRAKTILENLLSEKESLDGKYYTNASEKFLEILKNIEVNAKQKNMDAEKLFIKKIKADRGYEFRRPKSRFKFRGRKAKSTSVTIEVEEHQ